MQPAINLTSRFFSRDLDLKRALHLEVNLALFRDGVGIDEDALLRQDAEFCFFVFVKRRCNDPDWRNWRVGRLEGWTDRSV